MTEEETITTLFYLLRQAEEDPNLGNRLDQLTTGDWDE
jgi:hypothetical protein